MAKAIDLDGVEYEHNADRVPELSDQHRVFVDEYLIDFNATRSYKVAYPTCTTGSASARAALLIRYPYVQAYLRQRLLERRQRLELSQDVVVKELLAIALSSGADFADVKTGKRMKKVWNREKQVYEEREVDGQFVDMIDTADLTPAARSAIASIRKTQFGVEVTPHDKLRALELLGKHLGMFRENVEISGILPVVIVDDIERQPAEGDANGQSGSTTRD